MQMGAEEIDSRSRDALVIARSGSDEAIQCGLFAFANRPWIASLALAMTSTIVLALRFFSRPEY